MSPFVSIFLPLAIDLVKKYIVSSETKHDDKVLDIVQEGCKYLAFKSNNTLDEFDALRVGSAIMTEV